MVTANLRRRLPVGLARVLAVALAAGALAPGGGARAAGGEAPKWLGDELPLPLTVRTPQDIAFKAAAERQYLIFNLMAGGRLAWQRGDYATAVENWETLLRIPGLDPQVERVLAPALAEARRRAAHPAPAAPVAAAAPPVAAASERPAAAAPVTAAAAAPAPEPEAAAPRPAGPSVPDVTGVVNGGGEAGGAVVWLKRLDGRTPAVAPAAGQFITQRKKVFLPHVLVVPVGSSVEFRNDDSLFHNAFSLDEDNKFDGGIRANGNSFSRTFPKVGPVEILCNIHSSMSAYVVAVDSPYFAKARPSGAFTIHRVPPGQYELSVWHEASSRITRKKVSVTAGGTSLSVTVNADKRTTPFVPDKYGQKRQPHLGY